MTQTVAQPALLETLIQYLLQFVRSLEGANKSSLTIQAYSADIRQFSTWLVENDGAVDTVGQISRAHIDDYFAHLHEQGQSGTTRARKLISLQMFFKYLVEREVIPSSPAEKVKRPNSEEKTRPYLTQEEYHRMLAEAAGDPREYCILLLFLHTGIRVSELCAIQLKDVNEKERKLLIHGKKKRERSIPLENKLLQAIRLYRDHHRIVTEDQHLFLAKTGEGLGIRGVRKIVDKYIKKAGITKNVSCHGLRRTCLTTRAAKKMNAFAIQKLAGHARMETTRIYVDLTDEDLRVAMEAASL